MNIITDDLRKRLKLIILAKLEELGVNADKELPDYILTILGNNKDEKYMRKSLAVFIAKDTDKFTSWLYDIRDQIVKQQREVAAVSLPQSIQRVEEKIKKNDQLSKELEIKNVERFSKLLSSDGKENIPQTHRPTRNKKHCENTHPERSERNSEDNSDMETEELVARIPKPIKVASKVIRPLYQSSPEKPRVASRVIVKRRIPERNDGIASNLFLKAMNEIRPPKRSGTIKIHLEDRMSPTPANIPVTVRLTKPPVIKNKKNERKIEIVNMEKRVLRAQSIPKQIVSSPEKNAKRKVVSRSNSTTPVDSDLSQKKRCKFWPECANSCCPYIHPNKPCMNFPKCSFGIECIFIHPPCRFAKLCYNPSCGYTHASKEGLRKIQEIIDKSKEGEKAESTQEVMTLCYYGGRCTSESCKYKHPMRCRFDADCKNNECAFYHGPLIKNEANSFFFKASQFKWHANT